MPKPSTGADPSMHPSYDPESGEFVLDRDGTPDFSMESVQDRIEAERLSPAGTTTSEDTAQRAARNGAFRAERDRLADCAAIASQIILYRTRHGLTQEELARKVGTSLSVISRIKSGQRKISIETLRRISDVLNPHLGSTPEGLSLAPGSESTQ